MGKKSVEKIKDWKVKGFDEMSEKDIKSNEYELSETEKLIFKPHTEGLDKLTETELRKYLEITEEDLEKQELNTKTIILFEETQKFIKENYGEILKKIINKKEKNTKER